MRSRQKGAHMEDKYSGKKIDVNDYTRKYIDSILIEERIIDSTMPTLETDIFGELFSSPIMTPAFSHLKAIGKDRENTMIEYARAAKELNILNWVGREANDDDLIAEILATGAKTVRIIKPYADHQIILDQIRFAEEHGAFAVGIDIDHVYGNDGKYDVVDGYEMGPVMMEDIKKYVASTKLPFVLKGILSVDDAVKCAECGVNGIVVSHHSGRIPSAVPPLMVLPQIAEATADTDMWIFADCHIDSGVDAFKAIALGADAVSAGRAIMKPLVEEGTAGVVKKIQSMNEELITVMGYTGSRDVHEIEETMLWVPGMDF